MTDRERLFQLIGQVQDEGLDYSDVVVVYKTSNERLVNHLINNGVTFAADNNVGHKWISVSEQLPTINETVLAICNDGRMFVGFYTTWRSWYIWTAKKSTKTISRTVTHWMPLPEPPTEE